MPSLAAGVARPPRLLLVATCLLALAACGPTQGSDGSDADGGGAGVTDAGTSCEQRCRDAAVTCGNLDGCECGRCGEGEGCAVDLVPDQPEAGVCVTCENLCGGVAYTCGTYQGCDCGACSGGEVCSDDAGGSCLPTCASTCLQGGFTCGSPYDGCDCGDCGTGEVCSSPTGGSCGPDCASVCTGAGFTCGSFQGCDCGSCGEGESCSSDQGGTCEPTCAATCAHDGLACGTDGACDCGSCGANDECAQGACVGRTCTDGNGYYCGDPAFAQDAATLYYCQDGEWSVAMVCSVSCTVNGPGHNDGCDDGSACPSGNGRYCAPDGWTLTSCTAGQYSVSSRCANGCTVAPPGHNDYCE